LETPHHRILQDNLLAGGNKERVEKMSKLAGQVQGNTFCCSLCFALFLHVIYMFFSYVVQG
jgi:hypothetical protein